MKLLWSDYVMGLWTYLALCYALLLTPVFAGRGTTPNLREIMIGRCWEYQRVINPVPFISGERNCTGLVSKFLQAFTYRAQCDVAVEHYAAFAQAAAHDVETDKIMFWEGVWRLVHEYTYLGKRHFAISDTLTGYMANKLTWCGQKSAPGINYDSCKPYADNECETDDKPELSEAQVQFWRETSKVFASKAEGTVHVMVNGSNPRAFKDSSVFREYELPNLKPGKVKLVRLLVAQTIGKPIRETCQSKSVLAIIDELTNMGLKSECVDDPAALKYLQCVDNAEHTECKLISASQGDMECTINAALALVAPPFLVPALLIIVAVLGHWSLT